MRETLKRYALEHNVPIMEDEGQAFLLEHVRKPQVKNILELGTAIAYTTLCMAEANPEAQIDTIEKNPVMIKQAKTNIETYGYSNRVHLYEMPIESFKPTHSYDLILVDAAKAQYGRYFDDLLPFLSPNGIFIFDDMIFHGMIFDIQSTDNRSTRQLLKKINLFRDRIASEEGFQVCFYDKIGDGILTVTRR